MKIDVTPTPKTPTQMEKSFMDAYKFPVLYRLYYSDGRPFSVFWTEDEILNFRPNDTVSNFINSCMIANKRDLKKWETAIKKKIHPNQKRLDEKGREVPYGVIDAEVRRYRETFLPEKIRNTQSIYLAKIQYHV